jgi:NADH:ubiquinone oxidoreductase subunit 6 (subunit J)
MQPLFLQAEQPPSRFQEIGRFLETFWPLLLPVGIGLAAVYLLLPRARRYPPLWGGVLAGLALALGGWLLIRTDTVLPETVLFYSFSGLAVTAGGLLLTLRNPVHAALSFALVVLSSCGLFLLQAAPFLMAATIIVYAGAIVVTFLFVIMLAQQEGISSADQRSREPFLATVAGFVLLGALLCVLHRTYEINPTLDELLQRVETALAADSVEGVRTALGEPLKDELPQPDEDEARSKRFAARLRQLVPAPPIGDKALTPQQSQRRRLREASDTLQRLFAMNSDKLDSIKDELREIQEAGRHLLLTQGSLFAEVSVPVSRFSGAPPSAPPVVKDGKVQERLPAYNVTALGRSLFSDYLLAVELAGVLLTVATIGAIVIAGRRTEGLR